MRTVVGALVCALLVTSAACLARADDHPVPDVVRALGLTDPPKASPQPFNLSGPFFDKGLSADGAHSCDECHAPREAWSSTQPAAPFKTKAVPSLYGAAERRYFFWDGRAASLEAQVMEVLENPREMNGSRLLAARYAAVTPSASACRPPDGLADRLRSLRAADLGGAPAQAAYERLSADDRREVDRSFACVAHIIADYIRSIPTPRPAWLDPAEKVDPDPSVLRGAIIFAGKGRCATCHYGPNFSDGQFHNIGIADEKEVDISDPGRFGAVRKMAASEYNRLSQAQYPERTAALTFNISEEMWGAFKTPSLVGLRDRHSFMHNGRFKSVDEVVDYYDTLKLAIVPPHHYVGLLAPLNLSPQERADLIAFLKSL